MKTPTFLCVVAMPVLAELTDADLDKIRLIVKEEIKAELAPIKADIGTLKEEVVRLDGRMNGVEKQVAHATNVTYGLIALIVVAIGIPAWRGKRDRDQERKNRTTQTRHRKPQTTANRSSLTRSIGKVLLTTDNSS